MSTTRVRQVVALLAIAVVFALVQRVAPRAAGEFVASEPLIRDAVGRVSGADIDRVVQRLQDFHTRYAVHDSCFAAAEYIRGEFEAAGVDSITMHDFGGGYAPNVVAVIPGTGPHRTEQVVIGAHYDSKADDHEFCPGADDNASGTAGVIECARVLAAYGFDRTIVFIAFSAEEVGMVGSNAYGLQASQNRDSITAMLNLDMIGYLADADAPDLHIITNDDSRWLSERVQAVAARYVPGFVTIESSRSLGFSDHWSFWARGYAAVMLHEDSIAENPYIHSANDIVGPSYNSSFFAEQAVKVATAAIADLAGPTGSRTPTPSALAQNYPNPFNAGTTIEYSIQAPAFVTLAIYDVSGKRVRTLVSESQIPLPDGYAVRWNGENDAGVTVASGVYFYRLSAAGARQTRRLVFLK